MATTALPPTSIYSQKIMQHSSRERRHEAMSVELERALIALSVIDAEIAQKVIQAVSEDDFADALSQKVFRALRQSRPDEIPSPFALATKLSPNDRAQFLTLLEMGYQSLDGDERRTLAEALIAEVRKAAITRAAQARLQRALEECKDPQQIDAMLSSLASDLMALQARLPHRKETALPSPTDILQIAAAVSQRDTYPVTGIPELDECLVSLSPGDLFVVAGRTSIGKTAFAIQMAVNAAIHHRRVLYISLEMRREELILRFLSHLSFQPVGDFYRPPLPRSDNDPKPAAFELATTFAAHYLAALPIHIIDSAAYPEAFDIPHLATLLHTTQAKFVVIDYLHLMASAKDEGLPTALADLAKDLKRLAIQHDAVIIGLSQINRTVDPEEASLENIYYSSALAFAASQVLMIRPVERKATATDPQEKKRQEFAPLVELALEKNRNGPVGTAKAHFLKRLMRFVAAEEQQRLAFL
jgi:replicative DNA helicase